MKHDKGSGSIEKIVLDEGWYSLECVPVGKISVLLSFYGDVLGGGLSFS